MRIAIVAPSPTGERGGNQVTAARFRTLLRALGHHVSLLRQWRGERCDLLLALHARRSAPSVSRFARAQPASPIVVVLTGTDLYADLGRSQAAQRSLTLATRLIVLQELGVRALPPAQRRKARVIHQSVTLRPRTAPVAATHFDVCVVGHLRTVKDPFRAALAAHLLPASSRVRVIQIGRALDERHAERARLLEQRDARYRWLGELPRARALGRLARAQLCIISSRLEGGANLLGEAIALGVPVLASRIDGNVGLLGARHPGYFPVGDTAALAKLIERAEREPSFLAALAASGERRRALFDRRRELEALRELVAELAQGQSVRPAPPHRRRARPAPARA